MILGRFIDRLRIGAGVVAHRGLSMLRQRHLDAFPGSAVYWEERYAREGNSGAGSYGGLAEFKAEVINDFVHRNVIDYVIEYGCGDGNQLKLAAYPKYLGFDVSETAVHTCRELFGADDSKAFKLLKEYSEETAPLTLSLDVIYHLVEDEVFHNYMRRLFASSRRYVIVYSSNTNDVFSSDTAMHVRHRRFTDWISRELTNWQLVNHIPNKYPYKTPTEGSFAEFFIFKKE